MLNVCGSKYSILVVGNCCGYFHWLPCCHTTTQLELANTPPAQFFQKTTLALLPSALFIFVILAMNVHKLKSSEIHAEHIVLEDKDGLKIDDMKMIQQWKNCNWFAVHLKGDIFRSNVNIVAQVSEEKLPHLEIDGTLSVSKVFNDLMNVLSLSLSYCECRI